MGLKKVGAVLLLASNCIFQETITNDLESEGYDVKLAQYPEKAFEKIETDRVNLILIDDMFLTNNQVDSNSEIDFILNLKKTSTMVPVVLMVSLDKDNKTKLAELLSNGTIEDCIFKPFLSPSLSSLLKNLITKNQKRLKMTTGNTPTGFLAKDRRKSIRNNMALEGLCTFIDQLQDPPSIIEKKITSTNISVDGLQFDIGTEINIPQYMELTIFLPTDKSIWATGEVMWKKENIPENTKSVGIHFTEIKPKYSRMVSECIMADMYYC